MTALTAAFISCMSLNTGEGTYIPREDAEGQTAALLLCEQMKHHSNESYWKNIYNSDSILLLPLDVRVSMNGYLERGDIHSWMRTSRDNLNSCQQYVRNLISIKFDYLLNHNDSGVTLKHLLEIPFIDPISTNASNIVIYFRPSNRTSSKYIGIDSVSGNAFISFWIKKVHLSHHQWKIITFIFNETGIDCIYCSDTSQIFTLKKPIKINSIKFKQSDLNDIRAINALLLNKKIGSILGEDDTWCLNEHWFDAMIWPRIKGKFTSVGDCLQCRTLKSRRIWVSCFCSLLCMLWGLFMLWLLQLDPM